ncbi:hypothetical protein ACRRTK_021469 [Alexandromys fortis]
MQKANKTEFKSHTEASPSRREIVGMRQTTCLFEKKQKGERRTSLSGPRAA